MAHGGTGEQSGLPSVYRTSVRRRRRATSVARPAGCRSSFAFPLAETLSRDVQSEIEKAAQMKNSNRAPSATATHFS